MQITQEQNNVLLQELTKATIKPEIDIEHEVTVAMLMKSTGRSDRVCRFMLEKKLTKEGWQKHMVIDGGKLVMAYYDPNKWKPEEG